MTPAGARAAPAGSAAPRPARAACHPARRRALRSRAAPRPAPPGPAPGAPSPGCVLLQGHAQPLDPEPQRRAEAAPVHLVVLLEAARIPVDPLHEPLADLQPGQLAIERAAAPATPPRPGWRPPAPRPSGRPAPAARARPPGRARESRRGPRGSPGRQTRRACSWPSVSWKSRTRSASGRGVTGLEQRAELLDRRQEAARIRRRSHEALDRRPSASVRPAPRRWRSAPRGA